MDSFLPLLISFYSPSPKLCSCGPGLVSSVGLPWEFSSLLHSSSFLKHSKNCFPNTFFWRRVPTRNVYYFFFHPFSYTGILCLFSVWASIWSFFLYRKLVFLANAYITSFNYLGCTLSFFMFLYGFLDFSSVLRSLLKFKLCKRRGSNSLENNWSHQKAHAENDQLTSLWSSKEKCIGVC